MSVLRAVSYIHIDIQLGAVCVTLYRDGMRVRSATHTTKIRTILLHDCMVEYESTLLRTCEKVMGTEHIDHIQTTVHTPFTYYFEDTTTFQTKKDIPTEDSVIQEIEPSLPVYIHTLLADYARDGVIIQHVPDMLSVRGYEVKYDTNVQPPYDASFVLQWVERTTYEVVRILAQTYTQGKNTYIVEPIRKEVTLIVGAYVSELYVPQERNSLPIAFGEKSILEHLQDVYDVPKSVVQSHLVAHHMVHSNSRTYRTKAIEHVYNAFETVAHYLNTHSYTNLKIIAAPYIKDLVQDATKSFLSHHTIHNEK